MASIMGRLIAGSDDADTPTWRWLTRSGIAVQIRGARWLVLLLHQLSSQTRPYVCLDAGPSQNNGGATHAWATGFIGCFLLIFGSFPPGAGFFRRISQTLLAGIGELPGGGGPVATFSFRPSQRLATDCSGMQTGKEAQSGDRCSNPSLTGLDL